MDILLKKIGIEKAKFMSNNFDDISNHRQR